MSLSKKESEQSGFTLIELMVVMAIIAILATAGLSAYSWYIKKSRDTERIADINAINKIIIWNMSLTGLPPQTTLEVYNAIVAANNGKVLMDPLASANWTVTKSLCYGETIAARECTFTYRVCDNGVGWAIGTRFESKANQALYLMDNMPQPDWMSTDASIFEIGSCRVTCDTPHPTGCPQTWYNAAATRIDSTWTTVIGMGV